MITGLTAYVFKIQSATGSNLNISSALNYDSKNMRLAMIDAMKYWVQEFDIDGFRCDVAGMVPLDFWDNAVAESFFGILKREIDGLNEFLTPQIAYNAVFDFIECWYNTQRLHSTIGYKSPLNYENEILLSY